MTNTTQLDIQKLLPTIGTHAMVATTSEQFVAAMPQKLVATMYPMKTNFTLNADLVSSQPHPNAQFFKVPAVHIYVIAIEKGNFTQATPRQWLDKRRKWRRLEYRHAYMEASIEQGIAWQIKINREKRNLSQSALAKMMGSKQSAISRAENESYGRHRIETLVKIANAFDCALQVRFIPYSKLARDSNDLSPEALYVRPYTEEISK